MSKLFVAEKQAAGYGGRRWREKVSRLKIGLLLLYYFGGTACVLVGAWMIGGLPYFLIALGIWAVASAIVDRLLA